MSDDADLAADDGAAPTPAASEHPLDERGEHRSDHGDDVGFAFLELRPELLRSLDGLGYEEPTPIQRATVPAMLRGVDLLAQAATGTGKTAAFALPVLHALDADVDAPQALVLVPTRELAVQVAEAMYRYGRHLGVRVVPIFGGQPIHRQLRSLDRGAAVVVATPGRALDHIGRGSLELEHVRTVVLDEADEMLDMGFADDIESILESTPAERQTVLFSATMPPRIDKIAARHQRDPERIQIEPAVAEGGDALIRQVVYYVRRSDKPFALGRVLDIEAPQSALVFCRTRTEVDQLTETMNARGYRAEALHGGMDQSQRDRVMGRLRDGTAELLVATDVAARGLDVSTLTHVVNYDVPSAPDSYVHRIGRVGRAGRTGTAITLAERRERRQLANIERLTGQAIEVGSVPTVADLRARQVELTVAAVVDAAAADDLDGYDAVLDALLAEGVDERTAALAAIKLVHEGRGAVLDEREIPDVVVEPERRQRAASGRDRGGTKGSRGRSDGERGARQRRDGAAQQRPRSDGDTGFVYVSLGRKAGVRPGDLVGAIANESGLSGREIGPIRIADNYSVVGVPGGRVDGVVAAMRSATMRGKAVRVRRYVD